MMCAWIALALLLAGCGKSPALSGAAHTSVEAEILNAESQCRLAHQAECVCGYAGTPTKIDCAVTTAALRE